jgi:hypothetical protein
VHPRNRYRIDLPSTKWSAKPKLMHVTHASPKALREHVQRFAEYFQREMHFNFPQFDASEVPGSRDYVPYSAFLFVAEGRFIGAGCFRHRPEESSSQPWVLDWIWLHPYVRRQGHLLRAWPELHAQFNPFRLAHPLSSSMESFLRKVRWENAP